MKKVLIACVGTLKEDYLKQAQNEYKKRISKFYDIQINEVNECTIIDKPNQTQIFQKKQNEAKELYKKIKGYTIALCINAKEFDSVDFANHIDGILDQYSQVTFVIGGSDGLDDELVSKANEKISFSKFTFPHQLMRIILLEQLYRCATIVNGKTYHK